MSIMKPFLIGIAIVVAMPGRAHAYLDPGAGNVFLQSIVAAMAVAMTAVGYYWTTMLGLFRRIFSKKPNK